MKPSRFFTYAGIAILAAAGAIWYIISDYYARQEAQNMTQGVQTSEVVMYKNPGCQCCEKWADYLERNNYSVEVHEASNIGSLKKENGVPADMSSCHTALIGGYVVEGHVPVEDIQRMLAEQPEAIGIAAPGMPASSPGMNTALNQPYNVYLFNKQGYSKLYAKH